MSKYVSANPEDMKSLQELRDYSDSLPSRHAVGRIPEIREGKSPEMAVHCQGIRSELAGALDGAKSHALFGPPKIDFESFRKAQAAAGTYQHEVEAGVCSAPKAPKAP